MLRFENIQTTSERIEMNDDFLSPKDAAKIIPGRPHISTVWRWMNRGVRGRRLRSTLIGGRRYIPREAIREFLTAPSDWDRVAEIEHAEADVRREMGQ